MTLHRYFLSCSEPLLHQLSESVLQRSGGSYDLSGLVIALSARRAGRKLLELFVESAEKNNKVLVPPRIVTIGELPESLYTSDLPVAPESVQLLAWTRALQSTSPKMQSALMSEQEGGRSFTEWSSVAHTLTGVWRQIAAAGLTFQGVREKGVELASFLEEERWEALEDVFQKYLLLLKENGYSDRDANRVSALKKGNFRVPNKIVIAGVSEMPRITKDILSTIDAEVSFLVYGSQDFEEYFDQFGTILKEKWADYSLSIDPKDIIMVDTPRDEAKEIGRYLASLGDRFSINEVTIGVGETGIVPLIEADLMPEGIQARPAEGAPLTETLPSVLLKQLSQYEGHRRFTDFAALIRHPWILPFVEKKLEEKGFPPTGLVALIDEYYEEHLPERASSDMPILYDSERIIPEVVRILNELVGGFPTTLYEPRAVSDSVLALLDMCAERDVIWKSKERGLFVQILSEWCDVPQSFIQGCSLGDAISILIRRVSSVQVPRDAGEEVIEVLGWLELIADDAPVLVISGCNEGVIPDAVTSDPFLPDTLRTHLGLLDNAGRFARDAYLLTTLLKSRKERVLFTRRHSYEGEPSAMSRLLLLGEREEVVTRILEFYEGDSSPLNGTNSKREELQRESLPLLSREGSFGIPRPLPLSVPITRLSVTSLGRYIACPYRFYLNQVARLEAHDDDAREISPSLYGTVAHAVLNEFGRSRFARSTNVSEVIAFLLERIDALGKARFGDLSVPVVLFQLENLKSRMIAFAHRQVEWVKEGWFILHTEYSLSPQHATVSIDNAPITFTGRVDRIDRHVDGNIAVIDYKFTEEAKSPRSVHMKKLRSASKEGEEQAYEWRDLQLPLYFHLLHREGLFSECTEVPRLGYMMMTRRPEDLGFSWAEWNEEELDSAWDLTQKIVRAIREERFWPPSETIKEAHDDFSVICGTGQKGIRTDEQEGEEL